MLVLYGMAFLLGKSWLVTEFVPVPVRIFVADPGVLKISPSNIGLKIYASRGPLQKALQ